MYKLNFLLLKKYEELKLMYFILNKNKQYDKALFFKKIYYTVLLSLTNHRMEGDPKRKFGIILPW